MADIPPPASSSHQPFGAETDETQIGMEIELEPLLPLQQLQPHMIVAGNPFLASEYESSNSSLDVSASSRVLAYLYISHVLSRWGDRMWDFSVGLFLITVWRDSLLLTSLYGLVEATSVVLMGVLVGQWVDKSSRLKVIQVSLGVQNGSVAVAAVALVVLLLLPDSMKGGSKVFIFLVILVNALGGIATLAGLATNISVERDWVVVIADRRPLGFLTRMNAVMRRIDLSCKLLAPVLVGLIMSSVSVLAAAILIAVWNVISVGFEYWLLYSVYSAIPALHERQELEPPVVEIQENSKRVKEEESVLGQDDIRPHSDAVYYENTLSSQGNASKDQGLIPCFLKKVLSLPVIDGWRVYIRQEMVLAAFAHAMLYLTVLSFGPLMTATLKWQGVPAYVLGLARGVSALIGICATVVYPALHSHLQTVRTGLWSVSLQWAFLLFCVASVWIHNMKAASALLMSGVAASRLGLWMFDLAVTQLMQESVPEAERGIVGGVQSSLQSFFEMVPYIIGMLIPHPKDFGKLVLVSYASVAMALILYSIQVYHIRGHLFHMEKLFRRSL